MNELINLIYPIVAAVLLASYMYVKQAIGSTPESFDIVKFSATVIVGSGIAVILYVTGSPISSDAIYIQIVAYSGLVLAVESWIKIVTRGAVRINISALSPFLPTIPAVASPSVAKVAGPVADVAPVISDPVVAPAPAVADPIDKISKIAVKSYPSVLQGVSPFRAQYLIACDPADGVHAAVKAIVDHGDGSPVEEYPIINGIAHIVHVYEYVQGFTLVQNMPSPYYARVFEPVISVIGRDGLKGGMNDDQDSDGKREISLTIEVKDAAAVASGKVTNYPAPQ